MSVFDDRTDTPSPSPGPAKEGIVLDREGNPIHERQGSRQDFDPFTASGVGTGDVRVFRGGWGLAALLGIGIPLFLVAGVLILGIFLAVLLTMGLLRTVFGGGRGSRASSRGSVQIFRL